MRLTSDGWQEAGRTAGPAQAEAGRRDAVRKAVTELVRSQRDLADDSERLEGYLRDYCPHQPAEVTVMVVAARSGVAGDLSRASEGIPVDAVVARLSNRLHAESGVDQTLARWAVETWAIALGRMGSAPAMPPAAAASPAPPPEAAAAPAAATPPAASPPAPAPAARAQPAQPAQPAEPAQPAQPTGKKGAPKATPSRLRAMVARVAPAPEPEAPPQPAVPKAAEPAPPKERPVPVSPAAPPPAATRARRSAPDPTPAPAPAAAPAAPPPPKAVPKEPRPSRRTWLIVAAVVAVIAAIGGILVAISGGDDDPSVTAGGEDEAPTTTAAPQPIPAEGEAVSAGTYATSTFQPGMRFTVESPWEVGRFGETSEYFQLLRTDIPETAEASVSVIHLSRVFKPDAVVATGPDRDREDLSLPAPGDVGWLTGNRRLTAGRPAPVEVEGAAAVQVEVTVASPYESDFCPVTANPRVCLPLFLFSRESRLGVGLLFKGSLYRAYLLNVGDERVLILFAGSADQYPRLLPEVERMVKSLTFSS